MIPTPPASPPVYRLAGRRVFVAGHRGLVGSALARRLEGTCELLTADRAELDLRRQADVERWMAAHRPDAVILAAARVGGILANATRPADFLGDNLLIAAHVIAAAHACGVEKLLFLGSSCIYPRGAAQPMAESALMTGPLEPTNAPYAVAKIAGLSLAQAYRRQHGADFICAMPTNLYGPGDDASDGGHVVPALLGRVHAAKRSGAREVRVWGTGAPLREFLHADDVAEACLVLMERYSGEAPVNVGSGREVSIRELAELIAEVVGWRGRFTFDASRPDGPPRKRLDTTVMEGLGWRARIGLREGLAHAYADHLRRLPEAA